MASPFLLVNTVPSYTDVPDTDTAALARSVVEIGAPIPVKYERPSVTGSLKLETGKGFGNEIWRTIESSVGPSFISALVLSIKRTRSFFPAHASKSRFEIVTARTLKKPADESSGVGAACHSSPSATKIF